MFKNIIKMRTIKYHFQSSKNLVLAASLELPEGDVKSYAIFAHCFTCSKDFIASREIAKNLCSNGMAVLRFDFTGIGNSQGDFANTDFSSNIQDIIFAAKSLANKHEAPKLLIGHSLGGAAILAAAPFIESAKAIVAIGAPYEPSHVTHLFKDIDFSKNDIAEIDLMGRKIKISKDFVENLNIHNQSEKIRNINKALLVMHSPIDNIVEIENSKMIYEAARHPKSFISLDKIDHLITNKEDAKYIANVISAWSSRYF